MRLLFVADGRSPIALNWITWFLDQGHEVHLASTFQCAPDDRLASYHFVPVAFSQARFARTTNNSKGKSAWGGSLVSLRTRSRHWLGPLTLPGAARSLSQVIADVQPQLVHAMRIPYEGMLAVLARPSVPLVISIWGNDFTLHAPSTPLMRRYTRLALSGAAALHTDCRRDLRLARAWGFPVGRPAAVLPGAGGVQPDLFYLPAALDDNTETRNSRVVNPRGVRAYVRNDLFFQAIPPVLERHPEARFLCPAMAGEPQAARWIDELGLTRHVELLSHLDRKAMADLFRSARLMVSPTVHDGTPNTLLEAMACGCLPVAGDLESLREWIIPGYNGLLADLSDPQSLARAISLALEEDALFDQARRYNARLIAERALYPRVMSEAARFYQDLYRR